MIVIFLDIVKEIYDSVAAHVRAVVHGYNSTIFAYGSTGSGKTLYPDASSYT